MMMFVPQGAKILTIEDDAALRQNIVDYLDDAGFEVIAAENGKIGLELFRKEKPDLVLTDIQMPELSGLEVLSKVAKESSQTPVIVMSEAGDTKGVIEALRLGSWDYLSKPFASLTVMEHAVCKALERSRLVEENRRYRIQLEEANQALKKSLGILEEDQEAGRSVQMRLLPEQGLRVGDYLFSHGVIPSLYLSGDFVDYFRLDEKQFGFYIADVSGHGASSAFVTVLLKGLVAQFVNRYQTEKDPLILQPDNLLSRLSAEIYAAKLGKYLTMVYGVINLDENYLTYAIGGHYPNPILMDNNNNVRFLEGKGFPVGIMKQVTYPKFKLDLPKGSRLIMFSDGIAEVIPAKDLVEKEQYLLKLVREGANTVEEFLDRSGVHDRRGLPDDITMLMMDRI